MSRSGYSDDMDDRWALIRWRGRVASATRGKRGQALLGELLAALDAMPDKRLISDSLSEQGGYCALGVVGAARGMDLGALDPENAKQVAAAFDIAEVLAREIVYVNDEAAWYDETPEQRWTRVRNWVAEQIREPKA